MTAELETDVRDEDRQAMLARLLAAVCRGDEAALETLYHQTIDQVYGLACRILGPGPDAEEIAEDVYLYVWNNAQRYQPELGQPIAWLLTLARSRAIDRYRYRGKHQRLSDALEQEAGATTADTADIVEEEPLSLFHGTRLRQCLDSLPPVQRQILTLVYFRGMTHAEIAQDLAMSLGTVKTHVRRTLIALREQVANT